MWVTEIIKFELLKIWRRSITKFLVFASLFITILIFGVFFALGTSAYDANGERHQALEAIKIQKENMERNSGILTDDRIQNIIKVYADSVKGMDVGNQEKFYYELQNSSLYWKDIHPNYPIYTWLAFVYSKPNTSVIAMIAMVLFLSSKMKSAFQVLVISGALLILPGLLEKSTVSSLYNHILSLLPGQATAFANILQQYTAYNFRGGVISLPTMICFVYFILFICSIWGICKVYRIKQVE